MKTTVFAIAALAVILLSGCATKYITPSGRADLTGITNSAMRESFAARPAAQFPAGLAFVRVQASGYSSYSTSRNGGVYGNGRYSVVTTREVEEEAELERIAALPQVGGVTSLSRLLLPPRLDSERELREAAARLKADLLVLYTFDTSFRDRNRSVPLTTVTLGITTTKHVTVHVTASALVLDTRTGFIYGAFEASEARELDASLWSQGQKVDAARLDAERAAFKRLASEFEKSWLLIVDRAKQGA